MLNNCKYVNYVLLYKLEVCLSNMMGWSPMFPLEYSWGRVGDLHSICSTWNPYFAEYMLYVQTGGGGLVFDASHCVGEQNTRQAGQFLDTFVAVFRAMAQQPDRAFTFREFMDKQLNKKKV